jgi:hypothetical protein
MPVNTNVMSKGFTVMEIVSKCFPAACRGCLTFGSGPYCIVIITSNTKVEEKTSLGREEKESLGET